ncbi:MAG TPA: pitrilysin family protein [Thermoanaerobaculia bacterium]|nr:pitrilysin family protein [Thermoanaerobaculia bacterium]
MSRQPLFRRVFRRTWAGLALLALALPVAGQDLKSFEERTTVHKLANGWTFILVERPVAPVFSFCTLADVGSAQEVPGITGLAHMFEHMAFKGSPHIGTKDWPSEEKALAALEAAYQAWQTERLSPKSDPKKAEQLLAEFKARQAEASKFVDETGFDTILSREGATGLNAQTGADETRYYYSLPANKLELFAFLESERFLHPVFREFYQERDVVQEERRMGESSPFGRIFEQFQTLAFDFHPYQQSTIGAMSDLQSFTMTDAEAFFKANYVPSNLITAIVGDIKAKEVIPVLEKYFGRIPARPEPQPLRTVEPPQQGEKTVVLEDPAQPLYLEAYHKPANNGPDQPVYDAIDDIVSRGRTSRLYRTLVRDRKLAVDVSSFTGFPGEKYPNLWAVLVVPAFGVTNEQVQTALRAELDRLRSEDVSDEELVRFKTRAKADLLRGLRSNMGLANELVTKQRLYGDWRELFRYLDRLDKVSKADIRRVAGETFLKTNRTVALIESKPSDSPETPQ